MVHFTTEDIAIYHLAQLQVGHHWFSSVGFDPAAGISLHLLLPSKCLCVCECVHAHSGVCAHVFVSVWNMNM